MENKEIKVIDTRDYRGEDDYCEGEVDSQGLYCGHGKLTHVREKDKLVPAE